MPLLKPLLGVLGGMGPAASADFYRKLIDATPAARDQDHIPILILGDPRIPDRSLAIESGDGARVLETLLCRMAVLDAAHVDAIAIPCNTAHYWLSDLARATATPIISMIEAAVTQARARHAVATSALVLGTKATVRARLYESALNRAGFSPIGLSDASLADVIHIIDVVKAGHVDRATELFEQIAPNHRQAADVVLLACTELPIAGRQWLAHDNTFIDTTAALAEACVRWAACQNLEGRH